MLDALGYIRRTVSMSSPSAVGHLWCLSGRPGSASPPPPWSWPRPADTPSPARSRSEPRPPHSSGWPEPHCTPTASRRPGRGCQFRLRRSSWEIPLGSLPWPPLSRTIPRWSCGKWPPARASENLPASAGQRLDASHTLPKRKREDERTEEGSTVARQGKKRKAGED